MMYKNNAEKTKERWLWYCEFRLFDQLAANEGEILMI